MLVYIFQYFVRTQYYLNLDRISLETIRRYERHMKVETDKSHTIVQENLPTIKDDMMNAPQVLDALKNKFECTRGASGTPLAYVYRTNLYPADEDCVAFDAQHNAEMCIYNSHDQETIACTRIIDKDESNVENLVVRKKHGPFTPEFIKDSAAIAIVLKDLFMEKSPTTYALIKADCKVGNGRAAMLTLVP